MARPTLILTLLAAACGAPGNTGHTDGSWVGTIATEGNVTTTVTESGSVWGGTATLLEEASIGVEAGDDPYMLGRVGGVAASSDRIYVIDSQIPALRAYDWNGAYMRDLGRAGEGPGEFRTPAAVGIDAAGQVWLHDQRSMRIVVFSPGGDATATVTLGGFRISGGTPMVVTADGKAYIFDLIRPDDPGSAEASDSRLVMKPYGIDGVAGEPVEIPRFEPIGYLQARSSVQMRFVAIPFHPSGVTAFASWPAVLSGYPDAYRFEIRHSDGRRTVVERAWQPVAVTSGEAAAHEQAAIAYMREVDPGWVWSGPEIPGSKPAFSTLVPTTSGEIWVVRPGPATLDPDCDEESFDLDGGAHCWPEQRMVDVFEAEGRYLGEVTVPADLAFDPLPFIRDTDVIARVEDAAGTVMVKRYRLVLPDE